MPNAVTGKSDPGRSSLFLWWLATAEPELLANAVVDRNRQRIVGLTVFSTWLFATFSWTYFFSTVVKQFWLYLLCGVFMGFVILVIDRALIKGISRANKKKISPLIFRGLLALTIGTFMAQPAVLFIFNQDVQTQVALNNQKKIITNKARTDSLYMIQSADLNKRKQDLETSLAKKADEVRVSRNNYLAEADGSGGTGRVGIQQVALAKKVEYEKLAGELDELSRNTSREINYTDSILTDINKRKEIAGKQFEKSLGNGFLTRIEAMNNLMDANAALKWRYYLIVIIFMLIELMPVISKLILPTGTYDEVARLQEEMEIALARTQSDRDFEVRNEFGKWSANQQLAGMKDFNTGKDRSATTTPPFH